MPKAKAKPKAKKKVLAPSKVEQAEPVEVIKEPVIEVEQVDPVCDVPVCNNQLNNGNVT